MKTVVVKCPECHEEIPVKVFEEERGDGHVTYIGALEAEECENCSYQLQVENDEDEGEDYQWVAEKAFELLNPEW